MGHDRKYGKVTTEYGDIPDGEPVVVFRARDQLAPEAIERYARACAAAGCPAFHVALVTEAATGFRKWQAEHAGLVRLPSSEAHRERLGG